MIGLVVYGAFVRAIAGEVHSLHKRLVCPAFPRTLDEAYYLYFMSVRVGNRRLARKYKFILDHRVLFLPHERKRRPWGSSTGGMLGVAVGTSFAVSTDDPYLAPLYVIGFALLFSQMMLD